MAIAAFMPMPVYDTSDIKRFAAPSRVEEAFALA
jgi:hypothetical protein